MAIGRWLAFVLVCFFIGGSVGRRNVTDTEMGNGESGSAARAVDAADFPKTARQQVLVQGLEPLAFAMRPRARPCSMSSRGS